MIRTHRPLWRATRQRSFDPDVDLKRGALTVRRSGWEGAPHGPEVRPRAEGRRLLPAKKEPGTTKAATRRFPVRSRGLLSRGDRI
ncbi:hypothetical protein Adeh_3208 [Anaeromyxobacter dehalogenans 2CP-C]|uniref:Uncharacterized protein n=1 Tax=Anaeromyxobacter dehalogenans (strain 2CP-C) TaxID=290397 RepID=Q2IEG8_ANADE|nr:hypothetical protein Adeh_3208 [Anaeromyxobacter dehalogenans 2CP-C]